MSGDSDAGVTLTVRGAEKRDAGRGIARLPESARRELGVLSGEAIDVTGERTTIAKFWPADADTPPGSILIDADVRANAGVKIGDSVRVTPHTEHIPEATAITLAPPPSLEDVGERFLKQALLSDRRDRPVGPGEQVRVEAVSEDPFRVVSTVPDGPVTVDRDTEVRVAAEPYAGDAVAPSEAGGPATPSEAAERTGVTYEDIGGLDDELELVREMIELPLSEPELFQQLGVDPPSGVLLHGPPGTGKTLIAKAVANEVDARFFSISGPEIMSKYKGESEEKLRDVFREARENAPSIVFFDEVDSVAGARDGGGDVENRVVAQLLSLMDGLESRGDVVVIGATNRVDAIDPALRRGGRFDREIQIGVPGETGRYEILEVLTRGMPLADGVDLERLAARTHGFVGADLDSLVSEAAMAAIRRRPADAEGRAAWEPQVTREDVNAALASVEPSAMREYVAEAPDVTFADVGGLQEAKRTLTEAVEWPLAYERLFEATATEPPSGVLLYGPPGTGKTLLARALAGESEVNFIHVNGPELIDKYVGESEKAVRKVFERARQAAPSIVFFDEIDAVAVDRETGADVTDRVVSQLLTELDGLADNPNLVVLAATNRRDALDRALLRPGRLDTHIEVPEPDETGRRAILRVHTEDKPLGEDVDIDALATDLAGYTGADIASVVREASMRAIREKTDELGPEAANERAEEIRITAEHFAAAREKVRPSR